jgi:hypothetical protein
VHVEAGMAPEPPTNGRRGMDRGVVDDDVHVELLRHLVVDDVEKPAKLRSALEWVALSDDLAGRHVESCEEVGRAVAVVRRGHALGLTEEQRQHGLAALQGLNLRFFVEAQHYGVVRRVEV